MYKITVEKSDRLNIKIIKDQIDWVEIKILIKMKKKVKKMLGFCFLAS